MFVPELPVPSMSSLTISSTDPGLDTIRGRLREEGLFEGTGIFWRNRDFIFLGEDTVVPDESV